MSVTLVIGPVVTISSEGSIFIKSVEFFCFFILSGKTFSLILPILFFLSLKIDSSTENNGSTRKLASLAWSSIIEKSLHISSPRRPSKALTTLVPLGRDVPFSHFFTSLVETPVIKEISLIDSFLSFRRVVNLDEQTIEDNSRFFGSVDDTPKQAITMGLGTIMESKKIVLMANGDHKLNILNVAMNGEVTEDVPASILQNHENVKVYYCE